MMSNTQSELEQLLIDSSLVYKIETNIDGDHFYPCIVEGKDFNDRVSEAIAAIEKLMVRERLDEAEVEFLKYSLGTEEDESSLIEVRNERIAELQKLLESKP